MAIGAEQRAYVRKLKEIERRFGKLERATIQRSRAMLKNLRNQIAGQIVDIESFDAFRIKEMTANLDELIAGYEGQLRVLSNGAVKDSMSLGRASVMEPLDAAGFGASFFSSSPAQVNAVVDFTADLITDKVLLAHMGGLVDDMGLGLRKQINSQIRMSALGGTSSFQTMRNITKIMGYPSRAKDPAKGIAYEAERILRTETNRAYNIAAHSQQMDLAKQVPGLKKQWMSAADSRTRQSHLEAHGQIVPVDKPFIVGGEKLMKPGDPAGSAKETINCRCRTVTVIPEIGPLATPIDAEVEKEKARRAELEKEKVAAKGASNVLSGIELIDVPDTWNDNLQGILGGAQINGLKLPDRVVFGEQHMLDARPINTGEAPVAMVGFDKASGKSILYLNPNSAYLDPTSAVYKQAQSMGWFADQSLAGMTNHELTHITHRSIYSAANPTGDFNTWARGRIDIAKTLDPVDPDSVMRIKNPEWTRIASEVSQYSMTNNAEFVAEVVSGTLSGKSYSQEILRLFESALGDGVIWPM